LTFFFLLDSTVPYVRAHYRRPRRSSKASVSGCGALLIVVFAAPLVGLVFSAITGAVEFVGANWIRLLAGALVVAAVPVGLVLYRWQRQRRVRRLFDACRALAANPAPAGAEIEGVRQQRRAAPKLSPAELGELEALYREAVADVLLDRTVIDSERSRLRGVASAFDLGTAVVERAGIDGFLEAYASLVADGKLSEAEEAQLHTMRKGLAIPDTAVEAQLALAGRLRSERLVLEDELRRAKAIREGDGVPITAGIKLKPSEQCYFESPFTERKERVTRTYVEDGVRHRETELEAVRSGDLYVTSERVLLVASGTTTLKLSKILDTGVDPDSKILALTVDGRKTPHLLQVQEPFIAAAHIERVSAQA
jgi:hypothetical protein